MTLRRKLLSVFAGLAAIALLLAGLTLWTTARWSGAEAQIQNHYMRSLYVQRVRAAAFAGVKEALDAALGAPDARKDYERALASAARDFADWERLADTPGERSEVERVRDAYRALLEDAERVFALVERGGSDEAVRLVEDGMKGGSQARFVEAAEAAAASDEVRRGEVRASVAAVREAARTSLLIAAVAAVSLVLLLAAYLASDLFTPLKQVALGLDDLGRGKLEARLDGERADEIGAIHRAFNRLAGALERRARSDAAGPSPAGGGEGPAAARWHEAPSRLAVQALLGRLRARAARLRSAPDDAAGGGREGALAEIEGLAAAAARAADFVFPLDLELEQTDLGDLLYSVLVRHREELARRCGGAEVVADPSLGRAMLDRLKVREALSQAVRNALAALPERGGRIGLRALRAPEEGWLLLEVADDGPGADRALVERALAADGRGDGPGGGGAPKVGLASARAVAEKHGGRLEVLSEPGRGTVVRLLLPLRE